MDTNIQPNDLEMFLDGIELEVELWPEDGPRDKTAKRTKETVKVRKVSIQAMAPLGSAWGKPPAEVAVYCDRDPSWVLRLTDESFIKAMSEGRRLNFTSLQNWLAWQTQTLQALGKSDNLDQIIQVAVAKVLEKK